MLAYSHVRQDHHDVTNSPPVTSSPHLNDCHIGGILRDQKNMTGTTLGTSSQWTSVFLITVLSLTVLVPDMYLETTS